jgi:hypothetical protein
MIRITFVVQEQPNGHTVVGNRAPDLGTATDPEKLAAQAIIQLVREYLHSCPGSKDLDHGHHILRDPH